MVCQYQEKKKGEKNSAGKHRCVILSSAPIGSGFFWLAVQQGKQWQTRGKQRQSRGFAAGLPLFATVAKR